ncbi:sarcosine oxidase subunit delta [Sinomonas halotolerans]|uniref:Sarcosine oxidase subunit delta n=1 Tax=Sinomonas halotolerans TaxID=1644133 RepID=A0ABU9WXE8_9MICC
MLLITCPHCGPRDETEFHYGGQAHVAYPENPSELTDAEWAKYLFYRENPKGAFAERWVHTAGCRAWFNAVRDTVTYEFKSIYTGAAQAQAAAAVPAGTNGGQQ